MVEEIFRVLVIVELWVVKIISMGVRSTVTLIRILMFAEPILVSGVLCSIVSTFGYISFLLHFICDLQEIGER